MVAWAVEEKKKWVDSKYGWLGHLINAEGRGKGQGQGSEGLLPGLRCLFMKW